MSFILTIFKTLFGGLCKFVYDVFDGLPSIPEVNVAIETFDLLTAVSLAQNFFLPMDTIQEIFTGILSFYSLRVLLAILRSEWGKQLISSLVGKFNGLIGLIMKFTK